MRRAVRDYAVVSGVGLAAAVAYTVYAIQQHLRFESGRDLAIFDQAVWHYSRLETPESSVVGVPNLLGDHLHPIVVVLAPVYAVFSGPETLLIAQSLLIAAAVLPIFAFARERVGTVAAYALTASYAIFWGVQAAAGYEFHEVAFAPPLIATAIWLAASERWRAFYPTLAALLLVKEDMALLVAFIGLWLALSGQRGRGAWVAAAGLAYYAAATEILIPHFGDGDFRHWSFTDFGDDLPSSALHVLTRPWKPFAVLVDDAQKVETLAFLLLPFLCLTLLSRLAVLLVPLVAERMLSSNEIFWGTDFHYSLAVAPVLVMGAAAGLANLGRWVPAVGRARAAPAAVAAMVLALNAAAAIAVFDGRGHPLSTLLHPSYYEEPPWAGPIERALATVPDSREVSVATQDRLLPHLSRRDHALGVARTAGRVDYIVLDVVEPFGPTAGNASFRELGSAFVRLAPYYEPIFFEAGWTVLQRRGLAARRANPLAGMARPLRARSLAAGTRWGESTLALGAALERCAADPRAAPARPRSNAFTQPGRSCAPR